MANTANVNLDTRTLNSLDLTWHGRDGSNDIDIRERDISNVRGFKIDMVCKNTLTDPLIMHLAILGPRTGPTNNLANASAAVLNSGLTGDVQPNFFRGSAANRSEDFSPARTGLQLNTMNINADEFVVLKHKKYFMESAEGAYGIKDAKAYKNIKMYVPYGRQVRYEGVGGTPVAGRVLLVYWFEKRQGVLTGASPTTSACRLDSHIVTYYRDSKC